MVLKFGHTRKKERKKCFFSSKAVLGSSKERAQQQRDRPKKKIFSISLSLSRIRSFPFLYYPLEKIGAPLSFCIHIIHTYADYK